MKILKNKRFVLIIIMAIIYVILTNSSMATEGKIITESARIREESSSNSSVISVATKGEKVDVIDEENGWYKVEFEDVTGYIRSDLVDTDFSKLSSSNTSTNDNSDDNINSEVSTSSSYDSTVSTTDNVSNDEINSSVDSELNNQEISDNNLSNQAVENVQLNFTSGSVFTIAKEANVRRLPSFSSRSISSIANGTELTVLDKLNHWIKVTDGNVTGWMIVESVSSSLVGDQDLNINNEQSSKESESNDNSNRDSDDAEKKLVDNETSNSSNVSSTNKTGYINVESARIREKPNGTVIDVVDLNDRVEILDEEDGWYKININEYKECYISKSLVTVNK